MNLKTLVEEELSAVPPHRFTISGDAIQVRPSSAQCLGMMLHELCTNALKYGALRVEVGHIAVSWAVDADESLMLVWEESGGPRVTEPSRKGTGSSIIAGAVRQIGGEIFREWLPGGLRCTFLCRASDL